MGFLGIFGSSTRKEAAKNHLQYLIELAKADGFYDQSEKEFLLQLAKKYDIPVKLIQELEKKNVSTSFTAPIDQQKAFGQLYDMVGLMLADGIVHRSELEVCYEYASRLGFEPPKNYRPGGNPY